MNEAKPAKPKELPVKLARAQARDLISALASGEASSSDGLSGFSKMPAAHRRAVLEAMREDPTLRQATLDRARMAELALAALRGATGPVDFIHSMFDAVFDVCGGLRAGDGDVVARSVLAALLEPQGGNAKSALPSIAELDPVKVVRNATFSSALASFVASPGHEELLRRASGTWGRLLAAMIASKPRSPAMSGEQASATLRFVAAQGRDAVPLELVLAVPWLSLIAGGVSDEVDGQGTLAAIPHALKLGQSSGPGPEPRTAADDGPPRSTLPREPDLPRGIAVLLSEFRELLVRYDKDNGDLRRNLSLELEKQARALADAQGRIEKSRDEIASLNAAKRDLDARLGAAEAREREANEKRRSAEQQLAASGRELNVLIDSKGTQLDDAKAEVRGELKKSALAHLSNLREYLLDMGGVKASGSTGLASTAFDEVIRTLQRQGFVSDTELPRMRTPGDKRKPE